MKRKKRSNLGNHKINGPVEALAVAVVIFCLALITVVAVTDALYPGPM